MTTTINYRETLNSIYSDIKSDIERGVVSKTIANILEPQSPMFKWTGGKRREIKNFAPFRPSFVKPRNVYRYVEPFVGGGAEYWNLNNLLGENVINDFDPLLTNFYTQFRNGNRELVAELARISSITDHDKLEREYYRYRDLDKNNGLGQCSDTVKAIRFYIVNQLAFSGMRRFNADGEFNVPFGHYKGLNSEVLSSSPHFLLLNKTEVRTGDFEQVMKDNDTESTYHFIDGPYTRVFKEYSAGNEFGVQDQRRLADTFKSMKHASVMIIIDKSDLTVELYRDYIKSSYELRYGVNIKNRSRFAVPDRSIDFLSRNQGEC